MVRRSDPAAWPVAGYTDLLRAAPVMADGVSPYLKETLIYSSPATHLGTIR